MTTGGGSDVRGEDLTLEVGDLKLEVGELRSPGIHIYLTAAVKVSLKNIALDDKSSQRTTRRHLSYGITQCYLTCHPIQVNVPRLTPARQAGARFTYPGVDL